MIPSITTEMTRDEIESRFDLYIMTQLYNIAQNNEWDISREITRLIKIAIESDVEYEVIHFMMLNLINKSPKSPNDVLDSCIDACYEWLK